MTARFIASDFSIARIVEYAAHGAYDCGTLEEGLLDAAVDHEVYVALAIAELRVVKRVVDIALGVGLDDGERTEALAQYGERAGMYGNLARLGAEHIALYTDEVAQIKAFLENGVVELFVFARADGIALCVDLYAPL